MFKTLAGMAVGGTVGWSAGFLLMLFKGSMDIADAMTAAMWPVGGAFVGVVGGALVAQAV